MSVNVDEIDLSDLEFWARPPVERHAAFAALRRGPMPFYAEPVAEQPWIESGAGYWAVLRHADIVGRAAPGGVLLRPGATNIPDLPAGVPRVLRLDDQHGRPAPRPAAPHRVPRLHAPHAPPVEDDVAPRPPAIVDDVIAARARATS